MSLLGRMPPQSLKHHQQATINGDASIMKKNRKLSQTYIYLLLSFSLSLCLYHLQCDQIGVLLKGLCNKFVNKSKPNLLGLFVIKLGYFSLQHLVTLRVTFYFVIVSTARKMSTLYFCTIQTLMHYSSVSLFVFCTQLLTYLLSTLPFYLWSC